MQSKINYLSSIGRMQAISFLIQKDIADYKGKTLSDCEMDYWKNEIYNMPCCTRLLPKLFRDAHEMHEEKGMIPHSVSLGDLKWCLKYRTIGYECTQSVNFYWLPLKQDFELRSLPAFKSLIDIYTKMQKRGKKILSPTKNEDEKENDNQINKLLTQTATTLKL